MGVYWIGLIVVGLVAGVIAKLLLPGRDPGGCIVTTLIGIVGALLGGYLFKALGHPVLDRVSVPGLLAAIVGAIILLLIHRLFTGRRG
ncbi:MAG TPA: GlsB/YeaQ/YmgE family stress response membrane protein [Gemmatimonadota bacterium]